MNNLNKKWWFRLAVVFYVLLVLSGLGMLASSIVSNTPKFSPYDSTFSVKCDDGYTRGEFKYGSADINITSIDYYSAKKDSYFFIEDPFYNKITKVLCANIGGMRNIIESGDKDKMATFLNDVRMGIYDNSIPETNNYEIFIKDAKYFGSWKGVILWGLLYLVIFIIFMFIIRYVFFYILTGKHKLIFNEKKNKV